MKIGRLQPTPDLVEAHAVWAAHAPRTRRGKFATTATR